MKRLLKNAINTEKYLGQPVEVINSNSKYYGIQGWVAEQLANDKFKLWLYPEDFKEGDKPNRMFVPMEEINDWVRILNLNEDKHEDKQLIF